MMVVLSAFTPHLSSLFALGTASTYRGRLGHGDVGVTGLYEMSFALHDAVTNGCAVGAPQTVAPGPSNNGLFTTMEDADGVALAAIQGLNQKTEARSQKLETENAELKKQIAAMERRLSAMEKLINRPSMAQNSDRPQN